jgi:hypothetical protein
MSDTDISAFIETNKDTLPSSASNNFLVYSVNSKSNLVTNVYNATGSSIPIVEGTNYKFVAVAEDASGERGIGSNVSGLSVTSASILRTVLDTVTFDSANSNLITFSGSVTADKISLTNYYTIATTNPYLDRYGILSLINQGIPNSMVSSNIDFDTVHNIDSNVLSNVVDVNSNVFPSSLVNKAYVYTYAIDTSSELKHQDISRKEITLSENSSPIYPTIQSLAYDSLTQKVTLTSSIFNGSDSEVTKVYNPFAFGDSNAILGDIYNYMNSNIIPYSNVFNVPAFAVSNITDFEFDTSGLASGVDYTLRLVVENADGAYGIASYNTASEPGGIPGPSRRGLFEDVSFKYNYVNNDINNMMFNKTINSKWCVIDANKIIAFTWSGYKELNNKYGIYLMLVDGNTGSKSDIYEVKYDGTNNYVLPCVCFVNNNIIIAYQFQNGTSDYQANVYYNVVEYSGISILNNTPYTYATQTRDRNSMTDIVALNDTEFIITWSDYQQVPTYGHACNRGGCWNYHNGWAYYYDIQFVIKNITGTTIRDTIVFENNDSNAHYHKLCLPSVNTTTTYYGVVNQYYQNIFLEVYNKSTHTLIVNNLDINTTDLASWNYNDTNPVLIESLTQDNFIAVWYDNYFTPNYVNKIYIREITYNGTFVTTQILLDSTTNYYNYGKPQIFTNGSQYDLFVVRAELLNAPNYPVYRYHYKLDSSLSIISKEIKSYKDDLGFDILPHVGSPMNIMKLGEDKYQETIVHTSTETTTQFGTYDIQISTGELL